MFAFVCALCCAVSARAQTSYQSPLPRTETAVNDFANVIDPATEQRMETMLTNLKQRAAIEFAVVTVDTTDGVPIFDYSYAVARGWGIGPREGERKGLLLLVAIKDRKYQIQVSRHLEGDLPDGLVGELGRQLREPFRAGDYSRGLLNSVQTFIATLAEKQGFSAEGIDPGFVYRPRGATAEEPMGRRRTPQQSSLSMGACCLIGLVVLFLLMMSGGGRRGGGGGGGCLNALLLGSLFSSLGGGRSSSGWGGGGFGGSSGWGGGGGGGGGFGGFGGGGDFGGGGAGGDW